MWLDQRNLCRQARLADKEKAEAEAAASKTETDELTRRLVELKTTEIERMNACSRMCEEMVANARSRAAEIATAPALSPRGSGRLSRIDRNMSLPAGATTVRLGCNFILILSCIVSAG